MRPIKKLRGDVTKQVTTCWESSDCREALTTDRLRSCVDDARVNTTKACSMIDDCIAATL